MSSVEIGVIALLRADATLMALVGDDNTRVVAGMLGNPDLPRPHVAVRLEGVDDQHSLSAAATLQRNLVGIACVADTKLEAISLRVAVVDAIGNYHGGGSLVTVTGADDVDIASIRRSGVQQSTQQIDTRAYRDIVFFSVWSRNL